jgi:hypothetical protein
MRRLNVLLGALALLLWLAGTAWTEEYKLADGSTIDGAISSLDDSGVVFRLRVTGTFSQRIPWSRFSQDALNTMSSDPRAMPFVEPFIELPPEAKPKPKPIVIKDVAKVERPVGRPSFFTSFTTPLGLVILGLVYLANLMAGYEVAHYRNRPVAAVCGVSALLPLAGPLIFLASPSVEMESSPMEGSDEAGPGVAAGGAKGTTSRRLTGKAVAPAGGGLKVAATEGEKGPSVTKGQPKIYSRGEHTINRRFIETQFSGFFRVVPTAAERDLVVVFKTAKEEYVAKRISRISSNEVFIQLLSGGGTKEQSVPFAEIAQIQIRHKDDLPK